MTAQQSRAVWFATGALWAALCGRPAIADDTELFIATSTSAGAQPNILLIVDNSGSMAEDVRTQAAYDGTVTYPPGGGCDATKVYWRVGSGGIPSCTTDRWFNSSALKCGAALQAFVTVGLYTDHMGMYDTTDNDSNGKRWEAMNSSKRDAAVECEDDAGVHGNGVDASALYAGNGSTINGRWGTFAQRITWGVAPLDPQPVTLWSGNYLSYTYGPTIDRPKIDVVKEVANDLLDSVNGVNVGLMTFNESFGELVGSQGGHVVQPIADIGTARGALQSSIDALGTSAFTPLSETMYEAALYLTGSTWDYGDPMSVAAARQTSDTISYESPIDFACQKNYVVYLTDGEPTKDADADTKIRSLTDANGTSFSSLVGNTCDVESYDSDLNPSGGECLDELAEFLYEGDFSTLPGKQNVTTHTVGFDVDLPMLADTAARGGGDYYTAADTATLASSLQQIVTSILATSTTFTAPTVAANAFVRTQSSSDLFISVFRPSSRTHWPGNLKKFRLDAATSEIADANGANAIDSATGFLNATARDFWATTTVDGADVETGGAAKLIPAPANRRVYTNLDASERLTHASNRVTIANTRLDDALLQTGASGEPTRDDVIAFINGADVADSDQDGDFAEPRAQLGDTLHSQPVAMIYGPGARDGLVFAATNDGMLHAVDIETGIEQWAFVPQEFLDDQTLLLKNDATPTKHYGIDGDLALQVVADGDEQIESGEKVYLFFGLRRGGEAYYALDVSDPSEPTLLWRLDGTTLPGLGQTWSTPVPARLRITGATQNADNLALVLGGGYEADQDDPTASTDTVGNSIYIVDSEFGTLLWHGGRTSGNKLFNATDRSMSYSFPADVRVIDLDGNGLADRMYAADMGGQIWRFDITNDAGAASLVAGGVIAQLGAAPAAAPALTDVRRFYYAPDIALINTRGYDYLHIGIGSGSRGNPLGTSVQDRFYALRDYDFGKKTQAQFDALTVITDAALTPITSADTSVPQTTSPGWRLDLSTGEKVLAEARTFNNEVIFTSFRPGSSDAPCVPQVGTNRVYRVNVVNAAPVLNLDESADPATLTMSDMYAESEGGPLPAPQLIFLDAGTDTDSDGTSGARQPGRGLGRVIAVVGLMRFPIGYRNDPVRTYWRQSNVGN